LITCGDIDHTAAKNGDITADDKGNVGDAEVGRGLDSDVADDGEVGPCEIQRYKFRQLRRN